MFGCKIVKGNIFSIKKSQWGFLILFFLVINLSRTFGQEGWFLSSSAQYSSGNYLLNSSSKVFYLYGGAGYQTNTWSLNISIPLALQNGSGVGQVGGMMLPNGNNGNSGNMMGAGGNGMNTGGMMGGSNNGYQTNNMYSSNHISLGDIYFNGSYNLMSDGSSTFSIIANAFLKLPTANSSMGLGTGKLDAGVSGTIRKAFDSYVAIAELGYIMIGQPADIQYKNPVSYGLGIGKFFGDGDYSLLLYYQAYTTILDGYDSPKTLSLGLNYNLNTNLVLSIIGSAGLSKVTYDYSFSTGVKWTL